jgi:hypothetical protein
LCPPAGSVFPSQISRSSSSLSHSDSLRSHDASLSSISPCSSQSASRVESSSLSTSQLPPPVPPYRPSPFVHAQAAGPSQLLAATAAAPSPFLAYSHNANAPRSGSVPGTHHEHAQTEPRQKAMTAVDRNPPYSQLPLNGKRRRAELDAHSHKQNDGVRPAEPHSKASLKFSAQAAHFSNPAMKVARLSTEPNFTSVDRLSLLDSVSSIERNSAALPDTQVSNRAHAQREIHNPAASLSTEAISARDSDRFHANNASFFFLKPSPYIKRNNII